MSATFLFLLPFTIFSIFAAAQPGTSNISLGSSLYPNNSQWLSNSGQFAFGFYREGNDLAIGIWFEKIQPQTIIWTANRDVKLPSSEDVKLHLSGEGISVILQDKQGLSPLISNITESVAWASMLDSGNFVLYNSNAKIIWQSFDAPTDTILSGQRLLAGRNLVSSISTTNHATGRFQLSMQRDGNLVQYPANLVLVTAQYAYWNTKTFTAGDNVSLNLDHNGQLYLLNSTGFYIKNITNQTQLPDNHVYRLTIDSDGILRLYSHSLTQNDSWSIEYSSSSNKCDPLGLCGLNAYCVPIEEDPPCLCLPGFVFIDQGQRDLGCRRNFSIVDCANKNETRYSITDLDGLEWEDNPYSVLTLNETACKEDCLRDCACEGAVYKDNTCRKQKFPLGYGRTDETASTLVKIGIESSGTKTVSKGRNKQLQTDIIISSVAMLAFSLIILAITGVFIYRYRVLGYKKVPYSADGRFVEDVTLRSYTYVELEKATKGFTDEVGKGAFGTVYKGVISNGGRVVAIKKLEKVVGEAEREFQNEMNVIGRTHHKNLVKLLGYCHDGSNRLLVYEYMTNGSLADFLFRSDGRPAWEERTGIVLNVAQGILYLHEECETQIIHCDIKPENILMSEQKCAKLADFGLAKLLKSEQTRTHTGFRGTRGYVAPEWHRNMPITVKADVYSFGVVLLEIICCRRSVNMDIPEDQVVLENWVYHCLEADELHKLVQDEEVDKTQLGRMIKIGLWCIQDEPSLRPSMKKVVLMLEGTVEIPAPPNPDSFFSSIS
ncbi:hypothetical protein PRUPE_8G024600 [Prunus persica]|uniref:Receptor-like serine/threonine-protein kinase n=1 Tax=Prunus persica TaxID=3760 RepID=A0A251MRS2_PRUPE|nr:G-type lectin S-receptor-like serine/threonine-protein kinase LECRK1 [Prunus persica]ONH89928.1 hypothetical protein PRUPE_8G024600 [Prunus persica]